MYAIEVDNVSKTYRVYAQPVDRLKEIILRRPLHRPFQPLRGLSLRLAHGEVMGVVGDNGAGKSTLLKILAGTLSPTSGEVICRGRVAALLELGAGFHREFSGRQNIYLNATLLGLSEAEIQAREADIIAFSELGEFIDRPVKTYSSGMYVRLAFSIATSVDPDILIIDEALSVGDAHFQKKCVNRIMEFKQAGKTILFCSHSLYMVEQLCSSAVWLNAGEVKSQGEVQKVVDAYRNWIHVRDNPPATAATPAPAEERLVWLQQVRTLDPAGNVLETFETGADIQLQLRIGCQSGSDIQGCIGFALERSDSVPVFGTTTVRDGLPMMRFEDGAEHTVTLPGLKLLGGRYTFLVVLFDEHGVHIFDTHRTSEFAVHDREDGPRGIVELAREWRL